MVIGYWKAAQSLGGVDEQTEGLSRVRNGSFRQASKFPLVAENCRWQALHLKTQQHRYSIGSVRGSDVVIRIIGAIFDATICAVLLLFVLIAMRRMTRCVCLSPC